MSNSNHLFRLPTKMDQKLRSIRRRQTILSVTRGVVIGGSAFLLAMAVAMALDWAFTPFSTITRAIMTTAAFVSAGTVFLVKGIPAIVNALGWDRAAVSADAEIPQLEERWTTVASCAASENHPSSLTSQAMLEQVTSEATSLAVLVQPGQVVKPATLRSAALLLVCSLFVMGSFLVIDWSRTSNTASEVFGPQHRISPPHS